MFETPKRRITFPSLIFLVKPFHRKLISRTGSHDGKSRHIGNCVKRNSMPHPFSALNLVGLRNVWIIIRIDYFVTNQTIERRHKTDSDQLNEVNEIWLRINTEIKQKTVWITGHHRSQYRSLELQPTVLPNEVKEQNGGLFFISLSLTIKIIIKKIQLRLKSFYFSTFA